jgi:hypothetical protein
MSLVESAHGGSKDDANYNVTGETTDSENGKTLSSIMRWKCSARTDSLLI